MEHPFILIFPFEDLHPGLTPQNPVVYHCSWMFFFGDMPARPISNCFQTYPKIVLSQAGYISHTSLAMSP